MTIALLKYLDLFVKSNEIIAFKNYKLQKLVVFCLVTLVISQFK